MRKVRLPHVTVCDLALALGLIAGASSVLLLFSGYRAAVTAHGDFGIIWSGPRAVLDGVDPYDHAGWAISRARYGLPLTTYTYPYPPWVAIALLPLGALSLVPAAAVWTVFGAGLAVISLRALLRAYLPRAPSLHALFGFILFASQPGIATFFSGQFGYVLVAVLSCLTLSVRAGRTVLAGLISALLGVKPQYFVFTLWALLRASVARGSWAFAAAAGIAFCGAVAVPLFLLNPDAMSGWLQGSVMTHLADRTATTLPNVLEDLAGPPGAAIAALALLAFVWVGLRFEPRSDAWLAVWIPLSMLGAAYARSYDQVILIVPLVVATATVGRSSQRRGALLAVVGAVLLGLGSIVLYGLAGARGNEDGSVVLTLAFFVLFVVALWSERHGSHRAEGARA